MFLRSPMCAPEHIKTKLCVLNTTFIQKCVKFPGKKPMTKSSIVKDLKTLRGKQGIIYTEM